MGKAIEKIAIDRGHEIVGRVDSTKELSGIKGDATDVAIEFSGPTAAFNNISQCLNKGIPVLSGTTGWLENIEHIRALVNEKDGTFFYASNYSLGVNLFFRLNKRLAELMNGQEYKPSIKEIHHMHKLDAPSGTAITLADDILQLNDNLKQWVNSPEASPMDLPIESERIGEVPGTHTVTYTSDYDEIRITHEAFSRQGFALGAVLVAEWLTNKKGMLGMNDFLGE